VGLAYIRPAGWLVGAPVPVAYRSGWGIPKWAGARGGGGGNNSN